VRESPIAGETELLIYGQFGGEFALTVQICAGSGTLRSRKFGARLSGKSVFDLCSESSDVG
jgi:hypothetical protein